METTKWGGLLAQARTVSICAMLAWPGLLRGATTGIGIGSNPPDEAGPDYRAWATAPSGTGSSRGAPRKTIEIATGMNFWDGQRWSPSDPSFIFTNNDFVANRVQHRVRLAADNLNVAGAVTMATPDGLTLSSTPVGIGLYDAASGQFALVGELTNCAGFLVGTNQVVYENAFQGVCASVVYNLEQGSFSQDVVFTGAFDPVAYGFPSNTTRIQIITELYQPPAPEVVTHPLYIEQNPVVRRQMASPDILDQTIGFGEFVLGLGQAYTSPTQTLPGGSFASVAKEFRTVGTRTFLIESIQFSAIAQGLLSLPPCGPGTGHAGLRRSHDLKAAYALIPSRPRATQAKAAPSAPPSTRHFAGTSKVPTGVTIDYVGTLGGTLSGTTVFQSSTNYFVSGAVFANGAVIIEGGTILKYKSGASLTVNNTLTCKTSQFRPAIFTGVDDDSVGDSLTNWPSSGYTGTINTNGYANPALGLQGNPKVSNCSFRYAKVAIANYGDPGNMSITLSHAQLLNCIKGVALTWSGSGSGSGGNTGYLSLNNVLAVNTQSPISLSGVSGVTNIDAIHCTFDNSAHVPSTDGSAPVHSYNSIFANDPSLSMTGGANNGFYNSTAFGTSSTHVSSNPFQTVGAGAHYLTNGSGFQGLGGTTGVPSWLLSDLKLRTTHPPPLVIAQAIISTNLTINSLAQRETNASHPDLGYHYDPVDVALGWVLFTNATITMTNPGTVLAAFGTNGGNYGLGIGRGGQFISQGTPNSPNWIVQFNVVQEQLASSVWYRTTNGLVISEFQGLTNASVVNCRFTDWSVMSLDAPAFNAPTNTGPLNFQDCEFHGGKLLSYGPTLNLTNCLLERAYADIRPADGLTSYYRNNLVFGGFFSVAPTNSVIEANLFDSAWITNYIGARGNTYSGGYNAYVMATNYGRLYPTNSGDQLLSASPTYYQGQLGAYYQPTNSALINADINTTADKVGLYHYCVVTNYSGGVEMKETNSLIDIGYHYVALGGSGLPITTSCSGVPDYLADANGDGLTETDELPWNLAISVQPQNTNVVQGQDATFWVVPCGIGTFNYQWFFNGSSISGATLSNYTRIAVSPADAGNYSVVVSNAIASVSSANAALTVTIPLTITNQSGSLTVVQGATTNFWVAVDGSSPVYQWWTNSVALTNSSHIAGATTTNLTITNVVASDATGYSATATNLAGSVTSAVATLSVILPPSITSGPQSRTNVQATDAAFSVSATGLGLGYQWKFGGTNIPGATASSYTRLVVQPADAGTYSVIVTNAAGTASNGASLTVWVPPIITQQPSNVITNKGSNVVFSVTLLSATTTPLTNQWYLYSTNALLGATNTLITVTASNAGRYSLSLTNIAGTNVSVAAWLSTISGGTTNYGWSNTPPVAVPTVLMTSPTNTSPTNPAVYLWGPPISISASAIDTNGFVITNVVFYAGVTNSCTNLLGSAIVGANTSYALAWTNASPGTNLLKAVATDNNGISATSAVVYVIMDIPPTVSAGTNQTVVWTEGASSTNLTLAGNVSDEGLPYGKTNLAWSVVSGGYVSFSTPNSVSTSATFTNNGIYVLQLRADDGFATNTSTCTVTIRRRPFVSLTAPTNNATFWTGTIIGLNATAVASDSWATITNVQFWSNGTNLIGMALRSVGNTFALRWTNAPLWTNALTAIATDSDGLQGGSNTNTVFIDPYLYVWITSPTNGQLFVTSPTNILLVATNTSYIGGSIAGVGFYNGTNYLGAGVVQPDSTYQFLWQDVSNGTYTVIAQSADNLGNTATNSVTFTVNAMPLVSIAFPTNSSGTNLPAFIQHTNLTLHGIASDSDGFITNWAFLCATGQVAGVVTTNGSNFYLTWTNLAPGTYPVTALATDNRGAQASSAIAVFKVNPTNQPPGIWITFPTSNMTFAAGANITIRATATNGGGQITNVSFFANAQLLGSTKLAPYGLTVCCWKPGTYVLQAEAADNLGATASSEPVTITVEQQTAGTGDGFWDPSFGNPGLSDSSYVPGNQPMIGIPPSVTALTFGSDSNLYAGGSFPYANGVTVNGIALWDGTNWQSLGSGISSGHVFALAACGPDMLVGGSFSAPGLNFAKWTSGAWQPVCSNSVNAAIQAIAVLGSDVYIGGLFTNSTTPNMPDVPLQYVAEMQGTNWTNVPGLNAPVFALASISNQLYVGGAFTNIGASSNINYLARLDGTNWAPVGTGVDGAVRAMAVCGSSLFVGGDFTTAGGLTNANHVARWNGTSWQTLANGLQGIPAGYDPYDFAPTNTSVCALAVLGNSVFVGGVFSNANPMLQDLPVNDVAQATWNEAEQQWNWYALDFGVNYGGTFSHVTHGPNVYAAVTRPDPTTNAVDLFIGGQFYYVAQAELTSVNIARWSMGRSTPTNVPTVNITAPANYAVFTDPTSITNQANATPASADIASVDFYVDGSIHLGPITSSPYVVTWNSPTPGLHSLTALATDTAGNVGASRPVHFTVRVSGSSVTANNDSYSLVMNSPAATLNVLANDTSSRTNRPRVAQFSQGQNGLGTVSMSYDQTTLQYRPNPFTFGTDVLTYAATDGFSTNAAFVTVKILSPPYVQIANPNDGSRTNVSSIVAIAGQAFDFDGTVTNVSVYWNTTNLVGQTTNAAFSLNWSNSSAGFFTFTAIATDNDGLSTTSLPVTLSLTNNSTSTNLPIAAITNLVDSVTVQLGISVTNLPMIRDGTFDLRGRAYDPDDPVEYQLWLYRPEDNDLAGAFTVPYVNVTPPQRDSRGFHTGGDVAGDLGVMDLTQIPNGTYDLQLVVRGGGVESTASVRFQLDTQLKIGQFSFSEQDIVIPANGIPLTVVRTYNSLNPRSADFGYSWTYAINGMDVQLDDSRTDVTIGTDQAPWADTEEDANGLPEVVSIRTGGGWDVTLTLPDGRRTTFAFNPSMRDTAAYAQWSAPPDVHATLSVLGLNEDVIEYFPFPLHWATGGDESNFVNHDVQGWVLQTQDGTKYYITRGPLNRVTYWPDPNGFPIEVNAYGQPQLTSIVQRTGDMITIGPGGIAHYAPNATNATRSVLFDRDSQGRIIAIWDPNSLSNSPASVYPAVRYVYHADTGNLLQVLKLVDRNAGAYSTNYYNYDNPVFPHYITSMVNPLGVPVARNYYDDSGRLIAVVDANGNTNQFIHNLTNDVEVMIDRRGFTNSFAYDTRGNVIATTNAVGGISLMAYDNNNTKTNQVDYLNGQPYATNIYNYDPVAGFLLSSINPLGFSSVFTYNTNGQILTSTDARGVTSTNYYDPNTGNLTSSSDALGNTTFNFYDPNTSLLLGSQDSLGNISTNSYDGSGNLTGSALLQAGTLTVLSTNSFLYDAQGNQIASVAWRHVGGQWTGATNTSIYDGQNRVVQTIDANGGTNTVVYDPTGRQQATVDALGRTTSFGYDLLGRLVVTTNADLTTTWSAYDSNGNRTNSTDQLGRSTTYIYDNLNRLVQTVFVDNTTNLTVYDSLGRVQFSVDARGVTNAFGYDVAGRRVAVTNAWGVAGIQMTNGYIFDPNGNQVATIDALGRGTTNVFDNLNRVVQVQYADGTKTSTAYDSAGRRVGETNQDQVITRFGYDGAGRLVAVTNAYGPGQVVTQYQYDEAGNETAQIDANQHTTTFGFDGLGHRIKRTLPGGQSEFSGYDLAGNLVFQTNFNGMVMTNLYDALNRLTNRSSVGGYQVALAYSATGQRTNMVDASGVTGYAYDSRSRLQLKTSTWSGGPAISLNYSYDLNGNVTNIWSSTSGGVNLQYAYDPLNRITNVLAGGAAAASYGFDRNGNLQSIGYGNGATNLYQYDLLNRLTNSVWKSNQLTLASFYYQLGAAGNRTNLTETIITAVTNRTYAWSYDSFYRLTNENISALGALGYRFDQVGNRTNRLASGGISGALPSVTNFFTQNDWLTNDAYDSNGNTLWDTNATAVGPYFYDVENRLTNFNNAVYLGYNGDGLRVTKTAGGTNYFYLLDDRNPSGYAQVLEEWTASGGTTNLSRVYNYGLGLISQKQGSTVYYFVPDGHGSTRLLTDSAGTVGNAFTYDAYGTLVGSNATPQAVYLYCGEQLDPNLGFYYLRARYYQPSSGRFWAMDSFEGDEEDPISLHKYLYCKANPLNLTDTSGHGAEIDVSLAGALTAALAGFTVASIYEAKTHAIGNILTTLYAAATTATIGAAAEEELVRPKTRAAFRRRVKEKTRNDGGSFVFLHGTSTGSFKDFASGKVDFTQGAGDFGAGFYTTKFPEGVLDAGKYAIEREATDGGTGIVLIFVMKPTEFNSLRWKYMLPNRAATRALYGVDYVYGPLGSGFQFKWEPGRGALELVKGFRGFVPIPDLKNWRN